MRNFLPLLAALILACTGASTPTPSPTETPALQPAAQSALLRGALSNGFRYALRPHPAESGRISLRLIVHAGSLDEQDDELGFAHFVEHMAFNGTTHYPPGALVPFFQRNGLAWGVDANADTSFTNTTYKIDLPAGRGDQLREALQILRDFADGITFTPAEVKRERGVILSELTARETNEWRMNVAKLSTLFADSRIPARIPLADARSIKRSTADNLRDFYNRAYRPERMTLLVVGAITAEQLVPLVEDQFRSLQSTVTPTPPVNPALPASQALRAHVLADPSATATTLLLQRTTPVALDAAEAHATDLADYVVLRALDRRLKDRQRPMSETIGRAGSFRLREIDGHFNRIGLEVQCKAAAWPAGVALLETELRRARESGFTAEEVAELTTALLANARAAHNEALHAPSAQVANNLISSLVRGADWLSPEADLTQAEAWAQQFTPAAAHAALLRLFPENECNLLLTLRQPEGVTTDQLLTAYRESAAKPLPAGTTATAEELRFRYDDFGPAGAVAARRHVPDLGLELVEFANGTRLNLRTSPLEPKRFKLVARIGRGFTDVPREQPVLPWLALNLLGVCDLGRHTRIECGRLIRLRAVEAGFNYSGGQCTVSVEGPASELDFGLRFLTAFLSDTKLEEAKLPDARSAFGATVGWVVGNSQRLSLFELNLHLRGDDPRFLLPGAAAAEAIPFAALSEWVRSRWLEGPLEIALVGDFTADSAVEAARATVGALPPRHPSPPLAEAERCAFAAKPYRNLNTVRLADRAATVQFAWAARDLAEPRRRRALLLANAILRDRLRVKLREELGETYSPLARIEWMPEQPDFGFANMEITFDPRHAQKMAERVLKLADELARGGATAEEFTRARAPYLTQVAEDPLRNDWWLETVLTRAQTTPAVLDEARTLRSDYESLTLAEVNDAAKHLGFGSAHVAGIIPAPPTQQPVPAK